MNDDQATTQPQAESQPVVGEDPATPPPIGPAAGSPCPRRRFVMKLDLGADSYESLCDTLHNIWLQLERKQYGSPVISGGYNSGFVLEWNEDAAITHESYVEANDAWLKEENN